MSAASAAAAGRRAAEARMTSRATIRRNTGRTAQDETTGLEVPIWDTTYADLPFRLGGANSGSSGTRTQDIGGVEVQLAIRTAHLPAATANVRDGDLIEVDSGENAGTIWRVVEGDWADQQTARRVPIVAADRPEEW